MTTRVIFDTDIGTDVDDCLALALILTSPELHLEAVTCVYGDVALRARMALELLGLAGRTDVAVAAGASAPLLGRVPVYWAGHEGKGLIAESPAPPSGPGWTDEHAVDLIVRTVMANPGEIHLVAVGPLTNVALALLREPRLARNLAHLTVMGGAVRGPGAPGDDLAGLRLALAEHNIKCDPEAAHTVCASGAPLTLVPLDVTTRVRAAAAAPPRIAAGGTPFHAAVANQLAVYPPFARRGWTHLHDPLAAATAVDPGLVTLRPLRVDVELESRLAAGATLARYPTDAVPANAAVALEVDGPRFESWFLDRLAGPVVTPG
ncbi:MAG TPA: nucleoside hydrolase [Chloroflexota bacterium]|jgi:purine nucleosidase|nr:nucleoside hydrolase [Chloroflexota bacterium]